MKKDILQVLKDLLKHRTEDAGSYEFVLEAWIEEAAAEIERLRERSRTGQAAAGTPPQSRAGTNASEAEIDALEFVVEEGRTASVDDYGILRSWLIRLRPEWESQSYEESNENRTNSTMNRDTTPSEGSAQGECAITHEERAAILTAADLMIGSRPGATLRSLLTRLK
jgi:hypothetical protein